MKLLKKKCCMKSFWLINIPASILHHKANLREMKIVMTLPKAIELKKFGQSATAASLVSRPPIKSHSPYSVKVSVGHCARQSISLTHENVIDRFSHDVMAAILVNQILEELNSIFMQRIPFVS